MTELGASIDVRFFSWANFMYSISKAESGYGSDIASYCLPAMKQVGTN
jgi:hypothetical protein